MCLFPQVLRPWSLSCNTSQEVYEFVNLAVLRVINILDDNWTREHNAAAYGRFLEKFSKSEFRFGAKDRNEEDFFQTFEQVKFRCKDTIIFHKIMLTAIIYVFQFKFPPEAIT